MDTSSRCVCFGPFSLDRETGELLRGSDRVELPPVPTQVLLRLVSDPGRLVTREELRSGVWDNAWLDWQAALHQAIRRIRRALDDSASQPTYIETVPRRGYRWIAPLHSSQPQRALGWPGRGTLRAMAASLVLVVALAALLSAASGVGSDADSPGRSLRATDVPVNVPRDAVRHFQDGRFFMSRRAAEPALHHLRTAASLAPRWSKPWAAIAELELAQPGVDHVAPARVALEAALARDPMDPLAWHQLARLRLWEEWDWDGADVALGLAHDLAPDRPELWTLRASLETVRQRPGPALQAARRAVDLVPESSGARVEWGWMLYYNDRVGEAFEACRLVLSAEPANAGAVDCTVRSLLALGRRAEVDELLTRVGAAQDLESYLRRQLEMAQQQPSCGSTAAAALPKLLLGDEEGALASLRTGIADGRGWEVPFARVDPLLASLVPEVEATQLNVTPAG